MTKLSPEARDLLEAARAGESTLSGSRSAARDRVRARVLARVGAGVAVGTATALGASGTAAKTAISVGLIFKCVLVVGVVGVAGMVATVAVESLGSGSAPPAAASSGSLAVAVASSTPVPPPPAAPAPETTVDPVTITPTPTSRPSASPRGTASPAKPSSLEAETALLEKAQAELRAGHPDRALAALDEHDAAFKGGILREEERAGRILALCAAGRTSEAKAEADRFLADSPRSPMAERVRSSCAGGAAPSP